MAHPFGERALVETPTTAMPAVSVPDTPILLDSYDGRVHVHWAPDEAVTPLGQLPFFIDYLKQAGLFAAFIADSPLRYVSPNAPKIRDILGTMVLSIVTGARRYAHINALRHDAVNPVLLGMTRICSDYSVLRGLGSLNGQEAQDWLLGHLDFASRPLLQEPWILDCDAAVKPIYGHQEGAVVGYNLHKAQSNRGCENGQLGKATFKLPTKIPVFRGFGLVVQQIRGISTNNHFGRAQTCCKTTCSLCVPDVGRFRSLGSFRPIRQVSGRGRYCPLRRRLQSRLIAGAADPNSL